jgi:hypothetical protein
MLPKAAALLIAQQMTKPLQPDNYQFATCPLGHAIKQAHDKAEYRWPFNPLSP